MARKPFHKKSEAPKKYEIIYGPHAILECIRAKKRRILTIYTTKEPTNAWRRISSKIPADVPIHYVDRATLSGRAETPDHNGIVAAVTPFKFMGSFFSPKTHPTLLLLDSVQDVRNLGAILRSAYCIGVSGIVLCKQKGAPLNPVVFKTSAGLAEYLDIYQAPSMAAAVTELKRAGYNIYMAVVNGGKDAATLTYPKPWCLVIGNEAIGISKEIQAQGALISLRQRRADISYNASVAAGILLFVLSSATTNT